MSATVPLHAVLACEISSGHAAERLVLDREQGAWLADAIGEDLRRLLPGIEQARLLLAGSLLDATEILRPGFPAHAALGELGLRLPRHQGALVAIGAHEGHMPATALQPEPAFDGAPMRYLPLLIEAEPEHAAALGRRLEQVLANEGEAGTGTADRVMREFHLRLEHARYLSLTDLMALTCVQYEHAGFAAHWPLIEAALLTPLRREEAVSPRGAAWTWTGTHVALEAPRAFVARTKPPADERLHAYAAAVFELRQAAALFRAHGLPLGARDDAQETHIASTGLIEALPHAVDAVSTPGLHALAAPGLGIVALQLGDAAARQARWLATPLDARGLPALLDALAERIGALPPREDAALAEVDAAGCPWPAPVARH